MGRALTREQDRCLTFMEAYTNEHGIPPTYGEIMAGLGLNSKSGVHRLVHALVERGYVVRLARTARGFIPTTCADIPATGLLVRMPQYQARNLREECEQADVDLNEVASRAIREWSSFIIAEILRQREENERRAVA